MAGLSRDKLTLAACAICPALAMGVFLAFPVWAPSWMSDFGTSRGSVMLIYSASGILMTLSLPVVGRLLTRVPVWLLIIAGGLLMGGGAIVASLLKTYFAFAAVYAPAMGVGVALAGLLPCQTLAVRLFPRHVGAIGGLLMVALAVTGIAFPLLLTPIKAVVGWRTALAALGAGLLILIPLLALGFMRKTAPAASESAADPHPGGGGGAVPTTGDILRSGGFWILVAGMLPLIAVPTAIQTNLLPIMADHGVGARDASLALAALALGNALGAVVIGWMADKVDPRLVTTGVAAVMAASLVALASGGGLLVGVGAAFALGLPTGGIMPLASVLAFRQFKSGYAPVLGLLNACLLPYLFGPPLIGWIRDQTGSYSMTFLAAIPLLALGAAGMWWLKVAPAAVQAHAPAE